MNDKVALLLFAFSFAVGFYLGYDSADGRAVKKTMEAVKTVKDQNEVERTEAIKISEKTSQELKQETRVANEEKKQAKQHTSNVLSMPLPDDTIGLLRNASSR